jgi:FkbM family methyltransferase
MEKREIETKLEELQLKSFSGHADQWYGHLTYSQHGEDLLFAAFFESIGNPRPTYLDIGAHHPLNCSNTALLYRRGSSGVNIDANPDAIAIFSEYRSRDINLNIGVAASSGSLPFYRVDNRSGRNSFSEELMAQFIRENPQFNISDEIRVEVMTLDLVISRYCADRCPDLLSIDAEGLDMEILNSYSFKTRPSLICVETGKDREALNRLLFAHDFIKLTQMSANAIYIDHRWKNYVLG